MVANRGEIAVRILRALKEVGIPTLTIYSEADRNSLHVRMAEEAYCIGPPPAEESYLQIKKIISLAKDKGVDGIHPGYGFLAENPVFAQACQEAGINFIGPPAYAIEAMGSKTRSREMMQDAGVPVVPGTTKPVRDEAEIFRLASDLGYPIVLKAVAGGGGKGMRVIKRAAEIKSAFRATQSEAQSAFGDSAIYVEKYLENPRHIEVQILGDKFGNLIHLGERECTIQRRHQKVIEESPSVLVDEEMRRQMGETAIRAARAVGYFSAGTVEFLVDKHKNFYFLEMNTRLQVEHPVTEMVTGIDLVKEMLKVAAGHNLTYRQEDIKFRGAAIECRVYAEDPLNNFFPCPGKILSLRTPGGPGVRDDTGVYPGFEIPIYYDPLISKVITWGRDREEAIHRMARALQEYVINGVKTIIPFLQGVMEDKHFLQGDITTEYIDQKLHRGSLVDAGYFKEVAVLAAALDAYRTEISRGTNSFPKINGLKMVDNPWKMTGRRMLLDSRL